MPDRFGSDEPADQLDTYFALARGTEMPTGTIRPLEMTKWFDTNYHYLVPELGPDTQFNLDSTKPIDEHAEARRLGVETRPVLVGPVSFLLLAKPTATAFHHPSTCCLGSCPCTSKYWPPCPNRAANGRSSTSRSS